MLRRVVRVVVDAQHDGEILTRRRRGDDDLLGAGLDVLARVLGLGEPAGGLDHHVCAELCPRKLGRVGLGGRAEGPPGHGERLVVVGDVSVEPAQHRVVLQHVGQNVVAGEVVDTYDLEVGTLGEDRPEEVAADPAEAIDSYPNGHKDAPSHLGRC